MTKDQLIGRLMLDGVGDPSSPVVGYDLATGRTFTLKGMVAERHLDAHGSVTLWLQMEEN